MLLVICGLGWRHNVNNIDIHTINLLNYWMLLCYTVYCKLNKRSCYRLIRAPYVVFYFRNTGLFRIS